MLIGCCKSSGWSLPIKVAYFLHIIAMLKFVYDFGSCYFVSKCCYRNSSSVAQIETYVGATCLPLYDKKQFLK